jgi:hypothetical protein
MGRDQWGNKTCWLLVERQDFDLDKVYPIPV